MLEEACELLSSRNIARGLRRRGARRQSVRWWRNEGSEVETLACLAPCPDKRSLDPAGKEVADIAEDGVDVALVVDEEGGEIRAIDGSGALCLGSDQPDDDRESNLLIERHPHEHPADETLDANGRADDAPVNEPPLELVDVIGRDRLVGRVGWVQERHRVAC